MTDAATTPALPELLARLETDMQWHTISGGASGRDLENLARELASPLPADWCTFLLRFGGGLFYNRHELFGPGTVLIHDIELVVDILTARRQLAPRLGAAAASTMLPIHQADGQFHWFDLRETGSPSPRVFSSAGRPPFPGFAPFLAEIVASQGR